LIPGWLHHLSMLALALGFSCTLSKKRGIKALHAYCEESPEIAAWKTYCIAMEAGGNRLWQGTMRANAQWKRSPSATACPLLRTRQNKNEFSLNA